MSKSTSPATPKPKRLRYPRAARLRLSREFALVRKEGRTAQGRFLRLSVVRSVPDDCIEIPMTRFGVITSRRVGGAVVRNRVRRRLKEVCRLHRALVFDGWFVVLVAKSTAADASFVELREEWLLLARRLSILPRS